MKKQGWYIVAIIMLALGLGGMSYLYNNASKKLAVIENRPGVFLDLPDSVKSIPFDKFINAHAFTTLTNEDAAADYIENFRLGKGTTRPSGVLPVNVANMPYRVWVDKTVIAKAFAGTKATPVSGFFIYPIRYTGNFQPPTGFKEGDLNFLITMTTMDSSGHAMAIKNTSFDYNNPCPNPPCNPVP
jgi:hypothetical protein